MQILFNEYFIFGRVIWHFHITSYLTEFSLRVAIPTPKEKQEGGNVYEKPTQIVFCDVTEIYDVENKLSFPSGIRNMISDKDLPSVLANSANQSRARRTI